MAPEDAVHDDVAFLTGSPQRAAILRALCEGPYRPTDLTDEVDATRTTVQRVLGGFCDRGWAVKRDGRYRATVTGRRVEERYAALRDEVERARELAPLAPHLHRIPDDLPTDALAAADVTVGTDRDPLAPVDRLLAWFGECQADHVRSLSPVVARTYNEAAADLLERGARVDLVIDEATFERSLAEFREATERGVEHERANVYVTETPVRFGVVVGEETAVLGVYDGDANLKGVIESSDEAFTAWAVETYDRFRAEGVPLADAMADDGE